MMTQTHSSTIYTSARRNRLGLFSWLSALNALFRARKTLAEMDAPSLVDPPPVLVSILRAGNGLLDGMLELVPSARVGFVGLQRDEATLVTADPEGLALELRASGRGESHFVTFFGQHHFQTFGHADLVFHHEHIR